MADDADEDVVFENSALHEYFKSFGEPNIDVAKVHQAAPCVVTSEEPQKPIGSFREWTKHLLGRMNKGVKSWILGSHNRYKGLEEFYGNVIIEKVLHCHTLQEEDANFLSSYIKDQQTVDQCDSDVSIRDHDAPTSLWKLSLFIVLVSYCIYRFMSPNVVLTRPIQLTVDIATVIVIILALLPEGFAVLHWYWQWKKYEEAVDTVVLFIKEMDKFHQTTQRCVRLIQETELIARGFTLASIKSPVDRLEKGHLLRSQRQCSDLRHRVFHTARQVFLHFRNSTNEMLERCPLQAEIDLKSNYLSSMNLADYGACVTIQAETEEAEKSLQSVTDNYSLSAIKALSQLSLVHLSEFLRRLTLCIIPAVHQDRVNPPTSKETGVAVLCRYASEGYKSLQKKLSTLTRIYNFQRCSILDKDNNSSKLHPNTNSKISSLYVAVHSLDLHLQAALRRCRLMEQEVELLCGDQYEVVDYSALYNRYSHDLDCVKADLEACKGCWEEGVQRLDSLTGKISDQEKKVLVEENSENRKEHPTEPEIQPMDLLKMGDPIVEDQVFEAYTDPTEVNNELWEWDELSPEEKAKRKLEREEAQRLLTELKTVISVRANDREERERLALAKMTQSNDNNDTLIIAPSDTNTEQSSSPSELKHLESDIKVPNINEKSNNSDQSELAENITHSSSKSTSTRCMEEGDAKSTSRHKLKQKHCGSDSDIMTEDVTLDRDTNQKSHSHDTDCTDTVGQIGTDHPAGSEDGYVNQTATLTGHHDNYSDKRHVLETIREDHEKRLLENWDLPSDSYSETQAEDERNMRERLERISGGVNLSFSASIATMAAARSKQLSLAQQTYHETDCVVEECVTDS